MQAPTMTVDGDRTRLRFGDFVLDIEPEGPDNFLVSAYLERQLTEHRPDDDWPEPIASFELVAPPTLIGSGGRTA